MYFNVGSELNARELAHMRGFCVLNWRNKSNNTGPWACCTSARRDEHGKLENAHKNCESECLRYSECSPRTQCKTLKSALSHPAGQQLREFPSLSRTSQLPSNAEKQEALLCYPRNQKTETEMQSEWGNWGVVKRFPQADKQTGNMFFFLNLLKPCGRFCLCTYFTLLILLKGFLWVTHLCAS